MDTFKKLTLCKYIQLRANNFFINIRKHRWEKLISKNVITQNMLSEMSSDNIPVDPALILAMNGKSSNGAICGTLTGKTPIKNATFGELNSRLNSEPIIMINDAIAINLSQAADCTTCSIYPKNKEIAIYRKNDKKTVAVTKINFKTEDDCAEAINQIKDWYDSGKPEMLHIYVHNPVTFEEKYYR